MQIAMHVITMNNQEKMLRLLTAVGNYFDVIRVCDGGSTDRTVEICKMFNCKIVQRRWDDDMSAQHNTLLKQAKKGEFILVMDDDECPSVPLLSALRVYADESKHGSLYRTVKIPSIMYINGVADWDTMDLMQAIQRGEQKDRFTKMNFFWYDGEVKFSGESHYGLEYEHIEHWPIKEMIPQPYYHYKQPIDIVRCNIQQAYINPTMQGIALEDGLELHGMFREVGIRNSHDMLWYLEQCRNVLPKMKEWFVKHRDPILGTVSDFFEYYFLYHRPEELQEYLDVGYADLGDAAFREFTKEPAVIRHLKDLGGYRSYTVDISHEDGTEHWLPIAHLDIHPVLREMLGTHQILIRATGDGAFDLDPFSERVVQEPTVDPEVATCGFEEEPDAEEEGV